MCHDKEMGCSSGHRLILPGDLRIVDGTLYGEGVYYSTRSKRYWIVACQELQLEWRGRPLKAKSLATALHEIEIYQAIHGDC